MSFANAAPIDADSLEAVLTEPNLLRFVVTGINKGKVKPHHFKIKHVSHAISILPECSMVSEREGGMHWYDRSKRGYQL